MADWFPTRNGILSSVHCQFLLLSYLALSRGYSHISLGEGKSVLLSPCITSIPTTMTTLFTSQLVKERWLGKEATWALHWVILSVRLLSSSSAEIILWWAKIQISLHCVPTQRRQSIYLFPRPPCQQFVKSPSIQPNHYPLCMNKYRSNLWQSLLPGKMNNSIC